MALLKGFNLTQASKLIVDARNLAKLEKNNDGHKTLLKAKYQEMNNGRDMPHGYDLDVATRWNSKFEMIARVKELE